MVGERIIDLRIGSAGRANCLFAHQATAHESPVPVRRGGTFFVIQSLPVGLDESGNRAVRQTFGRTQGRAAQADTGSGHGAGRQSVAPPFFALGCAVPRRVTFSSGPRQARGLVEPGDTALTGSIVRADKPPVRHCRDQRSLVLHDGPVALNIPGGSWDVPDRETAGHGAVARTLSWRSGPPRHGRRAGGRPAPHRMHRGASTCGKPSLEAALTGEASPAGTGARMPSGHEAPPQSGEFGRSSDRAGGRPAPVLGDGAAWKATSVQRNSQTRRTQQTSSADTQRRPEASVGTARQSDWLLPAGVAPGPHRQGQTDRAGGGDRI